MINLSEEDDKLLMRNLNLPSTFEELIEDVFLEQQIFGMPQQFNPLSECKDVNYHYDNDNSSQQQFVDPDAYLDQPEEQFQDQVQENHEFQNQVQVHKKLQNQKQILANKRQDQSESEEEKEHFGADEEMDGLEEKNFKKEMIKNVNMPKYMGRLMIKYGCSFRRMFDKDEGYDRLMSILKEKDEWIKEDKLNTFKLEHLKELFNNQEWSREDCRKYRCIMRKILVKHMRAQILSNKQVKDKDSYLISSKVYALRCRNATLAERMQAR